MSIIKKKDFKKIKFIYETVDGTIEELVDPDGSFIDSAMPDGNEVDITTGPIQTAAKNRGTTTYEKGIPPTTDKVRNSTSQGDSWQRAFAGLGGTAYSAGSRVGTWIGWLHENTIEEDVLGGKTNTEDMVSKISDKELTDNKEFMDIVSKIVKLNNKEKKEIEKLLSDAKS